MNNNDKIKNAVNAFQNSVKGMAGNDMAYFAFGTNRAGKMGISFGGAADLLGLMLSYSMAMIIENTPGLNESFVDLTADVAKKMLDDIKQGVPMEITGGNVQ